MAELADLFVSFKPFDPEKDGRSDYNKHDIDESSQNQLLEVLENMKSRAKQIADSQSEEDPVQDTPAETQDDYQADPYADLEDQPKEFQWITQQLRQAWQAPEDVVIPQLPENHGFGSYDPSLFSGRVTKYSRGNLDKEIAELFKKHGINIRVTSGKRKAGAVGKAGNRSYHVTGNACDIVPGEGETFESIRRKIVSNPEIVRFMYENGLGIIDETSPAAMAKTGATGKHYHIGPDQWALKDWHSWTGISNPLWAGRSKATAGSTDKRAEWARNTYNAFVKGLKDEFGNKYTDSKYRKTAAFMTYQAALESGYGQKANGFNYSGHMRGGKTIHYSTMDEFVKAHIKTLKKWDFMSAETLKDYIDSLHRGQYKYCASSTPGEYYRQVNGTTSRVNGYLGLNARFGGKFSDIRELYDKSFS